MPPRVLASGPKPCGGNDLGGAVEMNLNCLDALKIPVFYFISTKC